MNFTLTKKTYIALFAASTFSFIACQQTEEKANADADTEKSATTAVAENKAPARPAPDFFVIPPDMAENRAWICVDESSDIFHTEHDCPLLVQCKGTFRNTTLVRAIEEFGRYNCQECSRDLDHIFDEDMVR